MSLELSGTTPAIKGVAGSVSAPAITGDDADTGISFPSANTIKFSTGGVERMSITDSGVSGAGGKILKVVGSVKTDTASGSAGQNTAVNFDSSFSQAITPTAAGSKILVTFSLSTSLSSSGNLIQFRLRRKVASGSFADITDAIGNEASGRYRCLTTVVMPTNAYMMMNVVLKYLDTPTYTLGNSVTYSFSAAHDAGSTKEIFLNREGGGYAAPYAPRGASTVVLQEVEP